MRTKPSEMTPINFDKLQADIKNIEGERFAGTRVAEFIMGMDKSYWGKLHRTNTCNTAALKKLCTYYNLDMKNYIGEPAQPDVTHSPDSNLDAVIVNLGNLAEVQKDSADTMKLVLQELKVLNTKLARMENLMGQLHTNVIQVKDNTGEAIKTQKESGSTLATISGRTKDLLESLS